MKIAIIATEYATRCHAPYLGRAASTRGLFDLPAFFFFCSFLFHVSSCSAETWQSALHQMPLGAQVLQLNRTNCVDVMLKAFQSNHVVKALIFMPGATDEFYMFHRAKAELTN